MHAPKSSSEYPPFFESLRRVLEDAPFGDPIILVWDFSPHMGNDLDGVIGRNGLLDLNLSGVQLVHFCANHSLSITLSALDTKTSKATDQFYSRIICDHMFCYGQQVCEATEKDFPLSQMLSRPTVRQLRFPPLLRTATCSHSTMVMASC